MQRWMGMPITASMTDPEAMLSEADAARYQRCLAALGIEWEEARAENEPLAERFRAAGEF
jgi:hypothetical protein